MLEIGGICEFTQFDPSYFKNSPEETDDIATSESSSKDEVKAAPLSAAYIETLTELELGGVSK